MDNLKALSLEVAFRLIALDPVLKPKILQSADSAAEHNGGKANRVLAQVLDLADLIAPDLQKYLTGDDRPKA